jgi:hypothetical protein
MHPFLIVLVQRRDEKSQSQLDLSQASRPTKKRLHRIFLHRPLKVIRNAVHEMAVSDWRQSQAGRPLTALSRANPLHRLHKAIWDVLTKSGAKWKEPQAGRPNGGRLA